ncbi:hypothetical protein LCGC14_2593720, partial [marine sediment metagenome]
DWYDYCGEVLKELYQKPNLTHIGDKNPFFHDHPVACQKIASYPKIWTIRDPRAVWYSRRKGSPFFQRYLCNVRYFMGSLDNTSLIIRFEDLLAKPEQTMKQVYEFLKVEYDDSFLNRSGKRYDRRFKWNPNAVDPFDRTKIDAWRGFPEKLPRKFFSSLVKKVMKRFDYK